MYDVGSDYNNGLPGQDEHFRGRGSYFPRELQFGNASIIIRNTEVADSGDYTCAFPRLQPEQIFNIKLVVGAAPGPYIRLLNVTEGGVLLECEVPGASPKPKVEWQDSDGNLLPAEEPQVSYRGDRYYTTLHTTVTRTNTNWFHCVATQEDVGHKIAANIQVPDKLFESCHGSSTWMSGFFCGFLVAVVSLCLCALFYIRKGSHQSSSNIE